LKSYRFAYSLFACLRMGMSGSASFQRTKKSWYLLRALAVSPERAWARARPTWASVANAEKRHLSTRISVMRSAVPAALLSVLCRWDLTLATELRRRAIKLALERAVECRF